MELKFNEHLKRIRKVSKTTQQDLAEYLSISVQSVSKWEKGTALPSIEFLPKIAEFYNCSVNVFFSEYELQIYEQFASIDEKDLIGLYEAMLKQKGLLRDEREIDKEEEIAPVEVLPVESMFLPALYDYLKKNDKVSMAALQRALQIGYALAGRIFDVLVRMGIVDNSNPKEGNKILKEKIDLLLPYIDSKKYGI